MTRTTDADHRGGCSASLGRQTINLIVFCALMAAAGMALHWMAGPPRIPASLPEPRDVLAALNATQVPLEPLLLLAVDLAWLLWTWILLSLALELSLAIAEVTAHGAAWVNPLRRFSNHFSAPLARRVVATAFALQVLGRGVPIAAAQSLSPSDTMVAVDIRDATGDDESRAPAGVPTHLVREGDTLWSIAEQAYGSGTEYRRIVEANVGRVMEDGRAFSANGVIRPGWLLWLPGAEFGVEQVDGQSWYTVREGDTLSGIASRVLGDATRWRELFELNEGSTTPDTGRVLDDADRIWPGLRLALPDSKASLQTDQVTPPLEPDLVAASAPSETAPAAKPAEGETTAPPAPQPEPLVRSQHAMAPVVLDSSDAASAPSEALDSAPAPPGGFSDADAHPSSSPWYSDSTLLPVAAASLGAAATIGGLAFGLRRSRRLRPLLKQPENDVVVEGGFAEAEPAHDLTRGLHGIRFDPAAALVGQLELLLSEHDLSGARVVSVRHGRSCTTVALSCRLSEQGRLVDLAPALAQRLGAEAEAWVSSDQDVLVRLERLRRTRLLPTAGASGGGAHLVPLGVLFDRQVFSVSWSCLGHVLLVGLPGQGVETVLTSLLASITARRSPAELGIWIIGQPRALTPALYELPHVERIIDSSDDGALQRSVEHLRTVIDERSGEHVSRDLVVLVPELSALSTQAAGLVLLAGRAIGAGMRWIMGSTAPAEAAVSPLLSSFDTRMVLRMPAEDLSVALLGVADAAFLGGGGRLLLRLEQREPVELYGYRVAPEHLDRLVKLMRIGYPGPPGPPDGTGAPLGTAPSQAPPELSAGLGPGHADVALPSAADAPASRTEMARAILQVQCLGGPRVVCAGAQVWPNGLRGDAKPWELLLFLACQPAHGVARQDVLAALWPDDDQVDEEGTHRIRQLRYRLRKALAAIDGAPSTDGICLERGKLRLDPAVVYSDAQEFLSLVQSVRMRPEADAIGRLERARSLYCGDLLDGPEARRYAWVAERDESGVRPREHFRRVYEQASVRLAELYAHEGALDRAIEVYREVTESDPSDERLWIALFELHVRRGDRRGLVQEELRLRECLRELAEDAEPAERALLLEPSREVSDEFARLLTGLSQSQREPATV